MSSLLSPIDVTEVVLQSPTNANANADLSVPHGDSSTSSQPGAKENSLSDGAGSILNSPVDYIVSPVKAKFWTPTAQPVEEPYHILNVSDVIGYAERTLAQWLPTHGNVRVQPGEIVTAEEVGDGNLNLVFRLLNAQGRSVAVLKQSLPYVRCVGESWPLTLDRNRLEAETLRVHYRYSPDVTEKVLFHNSTMAVTVMEDLSDYVIWRRSLIRGQHLSHVAPTLGRYLARVLFHTSDFAVDPATKKHAVQEFINVDMCQITEDLFFADPYVVHPRNNYEAAQEDVVRRVLREDPELLVKVAQLKHAFMNKPEAHLHGDIHSGSVFVDSTRVKAIDAEFGFYGPMGFDLGTLIANLLLNYVALPSILAQNPESTDAAAQEVAPAVDEDAPRAPVDLGAAVRASPALVLESVAAAWNTFAREFAALAAKETRDVSFAFPGYVEAFLRSVWKDTVGFTGSEVIRRTVGLAHVADVDGIVNDADRLAVKEDALLLGAYLIKEADGITSVEKLNEVVAKRLYAQ